MGNCMNIRASFDLTFGRCRKVSRQKNAFTNKSGRAMTVCLRGEKSNGDISRSVRWLRHPS